MPPSFSSKPDGITTRDMDIKREEGDRSESQLREEPPAPPTNSMTTNATKLTTLEPSRDSSLKSVRHDLIKTEDEVSQMGSKPPMRTRQTSRLALATLVSSKAANPEVPPQVRSDVEQPQSKGRATTTQNEPSSGEDSQEDYEATKVKKQLRQTRAQIRKQNTQLSSTEWTVKRLKEDLRKEKEKVKSKRDEYQKKIKSGPITMGDDGQMRTLLSRLGEMCKDWAAKYAIPDEADRMYNDVEKSSILKLLKLRYNAVSDHGKAKIFDGMTNCAELLLNAALTHLVWFEILNRPFYFVEHAGTAEAPAGIEEALDWLVQLGDLSGTVAQKLTYCWLGTLLKALNPNTTAEADGELEKAARSKNKTMKDTAFKGLENVLKRHCGPLFIEATDKEAKQRHDRLWHIFRQAHELSHKLWTQGYKIKCSGRTSLLAQFKNKSSFMRAHLTMLIDDTETSRNGQEVYLVTSPYLEAYGNESGEFDQAIRVLNPATVCIAAREDLEQASRARLEEKKKQEHSFFGSRTNMDDASSKAQAPSFSGLHALDPTRAKNNLSTPDEQTQNLSESTTTRTHLREDEFHIEHVNVKTGKRKRVGTYVKVFEHAEASADSIADVHDNDEPAPKKR